MSYQVSGPKGGTIIKRGKIARIRAALPALIKRFGRVQVKAAPKLPPTSADTARHALAVAVTQLGTKESPAGSNHQKYGVWYGLDRQPWCAIFASWCYTQAKRKLHYCYVPSIVADAKAHRNGLSIVLPSAVRPGDLVCYDWPGESPGVADHVGLFERWIGNGRTTFHAIEGNTSLGNNSNGGEVMRRLRSTSNVQAFVRVD